MKKKNYIAYGSNLSVSQMAHRCPTAEIVGSATLKNYRLVFRGTNGNTHCTVEKAQGYSVPVLVWSITPSDEASLDLYEGFPRYYDKAYVNIKVGKSYRRAMYYFMTDGHNLGAPSRYYFDVVRNGYKAFGFDLDILQTALRESCRA